MTTIRDLVILWEQKHKDADAIVYYPDSQFPVEAVYYSPYKERNSIKGLIREEKKIDYTEDSGPNMHYQPGIDLLDTTPKDFIEGNKEVIEQAAELNPELKKLLGDIFK